ncbi:MAG: prepilin-type N-terminal cleavage/methylation domain-containing protein [Burkholderiaceae bacterium]
MGQQVRCPKKNGFTLVELLVALVIMALLALLSWRGLDGMTRVQSQTQSHTDGVLALQAGLAQWQTDLDAISLQTNVLGVSGLNYDGNVLRLTRRYAEDGDKSDKFEKSDSIRVVAWSQRVVDEKTSWLRWQSPPLKTRAELQAAWLQAATWAKEGNEADRKREVAVATVDKWQMLYYENDAWVNAQSSGGMDSATGTATIPDGIRLVLTLAQGQALVGNITRDWARPTLGGGK